MIYNPEEEPLHFVLHEGPGKLAWGNRYINLQAKSLGYNVLVLTADTHQDQDGSVARTGINLLYYPTVDDAWLAEQPFFRKGVIDRAKTLATGVRNGHRVLITCAEGYNRSALLAARVLFELKGWSGISILAAVRQLRPQALFNAGFREWVLEWGDKRD